MEAITTYSRLGDRCRTFSCRAAAWLQEQRAASPMSKYGSGRALANLQLWMVSFMISGIFASVMGFALVVAELDAIDRLFDKIIVEQTGGEDAR